MDWGVAGPRGREISDGGNEKDLRSSRVGPGHGGHACQRRFGGELASGRGANGQEGIYGVLRHVVVA